MKAPPFRYHAPDDLASAVALLAQFENARVLAGGQSLMPMMNLRVAAYGFLRKLWTSYLALAGTGLTVIIGLSVMVEMVYHIKLNEALGPEMTFMGVTLDTHGVDAWVGAVFLLITGVGCFEVARREFMRQWGHIQEEIEAENLRRDGQ